MSPARTALAPLALLLLAGAASAQTTWFVDASAAPPGDGTPGSPYASIQYAHDQATTLPGDTLAIQAGVYPERLSLVPPKGLTLRGAGSDQTRLAGGGEVIASTALLRFEDLAFEDQPVNFELANVAFEDVLVTGVQASSAVIAVTLNGTHATWRRVTVTDNTAGGVAVLGSWVEFEDCTFSHQASLVGTIFANSSTVAMTGCAFRDNHVVDAHGGALRIDNCDTTLVDCTFEDNTSTQNGRLGGAVYQGGGGQLSIVGGVFRGNRADRGGGLALLGPATLSGVVFEDNVAQRDGTSAFMTGQGGAIYVSFAGTLTADACRFLDNSAPDGMPLWPDDQVGGAVYALDAGSSVRGSLFAGNVSGQSGAAVHGPVELVACVLRQNANTGGGGTVQGATLERCTVALNAPAPGAAALMGSSAASSIVWANAGAQLDGGSSARWSCVQGGAAGAGNLADDPLFVDPLDGDLNLAQGSPCVDAGAPTAPLDGDLTPADMGALPFTWQPIGASYCSTNPNSSGQAAVMSALGSPVVAEDFVRLQATQVPAHRLGVFLLSRSQDLVPFFGGSQGNLCLGPPIVRLVNTPGSVSSSGAQGVLNLRLGLTTLPAGLQVLPGQTWHLQGWFRDEVAGQQTSNTTDAVSVTFH